MVRGLVPVAFNTLVVLNELPQDMSRLDGLLPCGKIRPHNEVELLSHRFQLPRVSPTTRFVHRKPHNSRFAATLWRKDGRWLGGLGGS